VSKLSIEDQLEIQSLYSRYARCVDSGDADGYVALFTEDGSFTRTNASPASAGGSGLPPQAFVGRAALHKLVRDLAEVFQGKMRHQLTDIHIEGGADADSARGVCYGLISDWREGAGRLSMHCTYDTVIVRTPGGWRFHEMKIERLPNA
jgi:ketosteroid isomerase-like protein